MLPKATSPLYPDGTFESKADCNNVSGTYETSGSNGLTITLGASTRMACGGGSLSDIYLQELSNAASYEIADSQLVITLSDEGTITFK